MVEILFGGELYGVSKLGKLLEEAYCRILKKEWLRDGPDCDQCSITPRDKIFVVKNSEHQFLGVKWVWSGSISKTHVIDVTVGAPIWTASSCKMHRKSTVAGGSIAVGVV